MSNGTDMTPENIAPSPDGSQAASIQRHNTTRMALKFSELGFSEPEKEALRAEVLLAEMMTRKEDERWKAIPDDLPCDYEYLVKTNGLPMYSIAIKRCRRRWPWSKPHAEWYTQGGRKLPATPIFYRMLGSLA